jgi:hypothetical protein
MRDLINILNEVTLSKSKYGPGQKFIISNSIDGRELAAQLTAQGIPADQPIELTNKTLTDQSMPTRSEIFIQMGKGNDYYEFRTGDNVYFYIHGTTGKIEKALNVDKASGISNRGETSEGILGAAMFAKFTKREANEEVGTITSADIAAVLDSLQQSGTDTYEVTVQDANNAIADHISFMLKLKTVAYQDLMNPTKRNLLVGEFSSAAAYVNSSAAERYSKYFYINGKADEIAIMADGAASETEKKADVWVGIKDKNGQMRTLKLNASLKTGGIGQFGQVGGSGAESMRTLFGYFGLDVEPYIEKYKKHHSEDQFKAVEFMYRQIAEDLQGRLAGNSDTDEAKFVDGVAHAITHFATLGDPNVELVDFDKGGFKILRFKNLVYKLRNIDLTASYVQKKRPELQIHDVENPKLVLLTIRCKIENKEAGPYVRNIIEKGPLLEELTEVPQQKVKDVETPDPEKTRVHIKHPGRKAVPRGKDSSPRQKRDKAG